MTCSEIRKEARTSLAGKWGKGALITLVFVIIEFILSFISGKTEGNSTINFIINIITIIISAPLSLGLVFSFMKLKRNEEVGTFDFITIGFSNFGKAWRIYGGMLLKLLLPIVLYIVSIVIIAIGGIKYLGDSFMTAPTANPTGSPTLLIIGFIVLIAAGIYGYIKSLSLSVTFNIAYDEPELTGRETATKSQELMNGNKLKFFLLSLSFIGWAILSTIILGIGFLWLIPYIQVSTVCFYEAIAKKN